MSLSNLAFSHISHQKKGCDSKISSCERRGGYAHCPLQLREPRKNLRSRHSHGTLILCDASRNRKNLAANLPGSRSDLQTVPGIGPKNESLMIAFGLDSVAKLQEAFVNRERQKAKMIEYLRSEVGVRNRAHARSIVSHLHDNTLSEGDEAEDPTGAPPRRKQLTFCVEGNISVGKTTFLRRIAAECTDLQGVLDVVPEPVDKWQNVVGLNKDGTETSFNLLDEFYRAPERYAYTFQNYVFYTRYKQEEESRHENDPSQVPLRLMERSVFSDRKVFVESVRESEWMNDMEMTVYDKWFDHVVDTNKQLIPNGFIYLQAEPDICHHRLHGRGRAEETGVSLEYLENLHQKHEDWFFPDKELHLPRSDLIQPGDRLTPKGVIVPAAAAGSSSLQLNPGITMAERAYKEPPELIRDRVVWMDSRMHKFIRRVPALILDCNRNIDLDNDSEAKQAYAQQLLAFFNYVRELNETEFLSSPPSSSVISAPASLGLTTHQGVASDSSQLEEVLRHVKENLPEHLTSQFLQELNRQVGDPNLELILQYIDGKGGDVEHVRQVLAVLGPHQTNKQKRFNVYAAISRAIGVTGSGNRQEHPDHIVEAIRRSFPEANERDYTGFQSV